jgi:hypothetical protein
MCIQVVLITAPRAFILAKSRACDRTTHILEPFFTVHDLIDIRTYHLIVTSPHVAVHGKVDMKESNSSTPMFIRRRREYGNLNVQIEGIRRTRVQKTPIGCHGTFENENVHVADVLERGNQKSREQNYMYIIPNTIRMGK